MLRLSFMNLAQPFQASLVLLTVLTLSTAAQAAPRSIAVQDKPFCFVKLTGKTPQNLNKLCGIASKRNNLINLDIDANRDGVSDQLLEATIQNQNFIEAETKRLQNRLGKDKVANQKIYDEYEKAMTNANRQFEARLPFSDQVKQALATQGEIIKVLNSEATRGNKLRPGEREALEAKLQKISQSIVNDPSLLKVQAAQMKVYEAIAKRQTAK